MLVMCVYVCACVCVKEEKKGKEKERGVRGGREKYSKRIKNYCVIELPVFNDLRGENIYSITMKNMELEFQNIFKQFMEYLLFKYLINFII